MFKIDGNTVPRHKLSICHFFRNLAWDTVAECSPACASSIFLLAFAYFVDNVFELAVLIAQKDVMTQLCSDAMCSQRTVAAVEKLFAEYDLDVNGTCNILYTPLTKAIGYAPADIVAWLLRHPKVDPNRYNPSGDTPLIAAVNCNKSEVVQLLLAGRPRGPLPGEPECPFRVQGHDAVTDGEEGRLHEHHRHAREPCEVCHPPGRPVGAY